MKPLIEKYFEFKFCVLNCYFIFMCVLQMLFVERVNDLHKMPRLKISELLFINFRIMNYDGGEDDIKCMMCNFQRGECYTNLHNYFEYFNF